MIGTGSGTDSEDSCKQNSLVVAGLLVISKK